MRRETSVRLATVAQAQLLSAAESSQHTVPEQQRAHFYVHSRHSPFATLAPCRGHCAAADANSRSPAPAPCGYFRTTAPAAATSTLSIHSATFQRSIRCHCRFPPARKTTDAVWERAHRGTAAATATKATKSVDTPHSTQPQPTASHRRRSACISRRPELLDFSATMSVLLSGNTT